MSNLDRPLRLIIDTGSDDSIALMLAAREPGAHIEALTVVAGNVCPSRRLCVMPSAPWN